MFTVLLLLNNVDDGVNKGYCGILLRVWRDPYSCSHQTLGVQMCLGLC